MVVPNHLGCDPATPLLHFEGGTGRTRHPLHLATAATLGLLAAVLFCMLIVEKVDNYSLRNQETIPNVAPISNAPAQAGRNGKPKRGLMSVETRKQWMPLLSEFIVGNAPEKLSWERFADTDLPREWDWRNVNGKNYLTPNKQQHLPRYCGGCWAFSSIQSLNDRINIALNASEPAIGLAHQVLFNCQDCGSCESGGEFYCVYGFAHKYGLPDETCQLYQARSGTECNKDGKKGYKTCEAECICNNWEWDRKTHYPVTTYKRWYVKYYGHIPSYNVHAMKAEIYAHGPIVCGMVVTDNFYWNYTKGIWSEAGGPYTMEEFDHAVAVSGWGVDAATGVEYWLIRNTWGSYFGEKGWFKVPTVGDNLGVGLQCDYATIDLERSVEVPEKPLGSYWDYEKYPVHPGRE